MKIDTAKLVRQINKAQTKSQLAAAQEKAEEVISKAKMEIFRASYGTRERIKDAAMNKDRVAFEQHWSPYIPRLGLNPSDGPEAIAKICALPCYAILPPIKSSGLSRRQKTFLKQVYYLPECRYIVTVGELIEDRYHNGARLWKRNPNSSGLPNLGNRARQLITLCLKVNGFTDIHVNQVNASSAFQEVDLGSFLGDLPKGDGLADFLAKHAMQRIYTDTGRSIWTSITQAKDFTYRTRDELKELENSPTGARFETPPETLDGIERKLKEVGLMLKPC